MKLMWLITVVASSLMDLIAQAPNTAPNQWEQPAATLTEQIVGVLGPGQAQLTIVNISTIPAGEISPIRRLLEQDLKARGVVVTGSESANSIRITLSENARERLWVAEVVEGNETRVAIVNMEPGTPQHMQDESGLTLRKQTVLRTGEPVLAMLETADGLVVIEPEEIVIYGNSANGRQEQKRVGIGQRRPLARDPRGVILSSPDGEGFEASVAGTRCSGKYLRTQPVGEWTVQCRESDDPWPLMQPPVTPTESATALSGSVIQRNMSTAPIKAFYNAARNYFTGVITPSLGVDLPLFYQATVLPRSASEVAMLVGGIDGKVQLVENGVLKPAAGTRDWGSDFAALSTGCGTGTQIVASGSGEAANDSLRAYELPAQEAVPLSAPLAMDGTVTALWTAPDGKNIFSVVHNAADRYEVDRVTASCN